MLKVNKTKTAVLAFLGALVALAGLLIFNLLPVSDLANSVEHSAKDAVLVLAASPACFLIGGIIYLAAFTKDYKAWKNFLSAPMVLSATVIFAATFIFNCAVSLSFFLSQNALGFVAPFNGLIYEPLSIIMTVIVILDFIFAVLGTAAVFRNSK